jgi:CubicO group peptidase (beta-lactamase class C family)
VFVTNYAKNTTKHVKEIVSAWVNAGILTEGILSLQSMDAGTLDAVRRNNIKVEKYDDLAKEFRRSRLPLFVDLMLGLPGTTCASFRRDLQGCIDREVTAKIFPTEMLVNSPMNDPAYRAAALPATNGIATADGLARSYATLIGEVDGVRLFTPRTVELARAEESAGPDRVLVVGTRFGLGYMLHGSASPFLGAGSFGHPGRGGSLGFADPESGIAFGYVTNGFRKTVTADPRAQALVRAVRAAL